MIKNLNLKITFQISERAVLVVSRFRATFTLNPSLSYEERPNPQALLERRLASLSARTHEEMTHVGVWF